MVLVSSRSAIPANFPWFSCIRNLLLRSSSSPSSLSPMDDNKEQQQQRVVVCGGGVIGVCSAYFLAKKGAAVTLVEKSSIACAASGKAGGFLALDWCDSEPISELARASFNLHRSLALELDGTQAYGYRPLNALGLTLTEKIQNQSLATSSNSNLPAWLDGPAKDTKTMGTTETTAQVHPQLFTRTLLSTAVASHGVEVIIGEVEQVEVEVEVEGGRAQGVVLKGGDRVIAADAVVLALGPWSCRMPLVSSLLRVSGLKAHSIVLEPRDPAAITPHALFLSYYSLQGGKSTDPEVYPRPTGEVYICGSTVEAEVPDGPEQVAVEPESIKMLQRVAASVSSHLEEGEAHLKTQQACFLPCTDDGQPAIGEMPNVKGCYVATGHGCWGILNGPATGAAVAELVLDGLSSIVDLSPFSPARFVGVRKQ
ncbi:putative oxidoreductase TDA3 [Macadamia integrifolia]|uniref:putative oxidoreductase TDA3 n=1 Tax=Macadamia integrifolia TaxID=60698 RepID=UPI001C4F7C29|nr:putative oxidoreductase TDA3 [Macadamia integrifolia]